MTTPRADLTPATHEPPIAWCVVANLAWNTKHFSQGTKVYVRLVFWGPGGDRIEVVGRHRGGGRMIMLTLPTRSLTNFRVKGVYSPAIAGMIRSHVYSASTEGKASAEREAAKLIELQQAALDPVTLPPRWLRRSPKLLALEACFRLFSFVRSRHRTRVADPIGSDLDLFWALSAAANRWPAGSFHEWLNKKEREEKARGEG